MFLEDVENAAKLANAHEFIEGLPEGPLGSPSPKFASVPRASRATPTDFMIFMVLVTFLDNMNSYEFHNVSLGLSVKGSECCCCSSKQALM